MVKPLRKIIQQCLLILKMDLPYKLAIKLLDIHPQDMIAYFHAKKKKIVHRGFFAAYFAVAKSYNSQKPKGH